MTLNEENFALMQETIAALSFRQVAQQVALTVMAHNIATLGRADLEVMAQQLQTTVADGEYSSEVKCCVDDLARSIRTMSIENIELWPFA